MPYELMEARGVGVENTRLTRMNNGEVFETSEAAKEYLQSILEAPKLGFVDYDWEDDPDHPGCVDVWAVTKGGSVRMFHINEVN